MKKWTRWQDWAAVAAGAVAALSTLWTTRNTASMWLVVAGGVPIAASGVINLAAPGTPWIEWVQIILGAALVLSPWMASYTGHYGAAWTSWIGGAVVVVFSGFATSPSTEAHHHAVPSH